MAAMRDADQGNRDVGEPRSRAPKPGKGKLKRKNLIVDPEKLAELARRRELSESATVREVVDFALMAADQVMDAIRELHERGGIDDVSGHLTEEEDCPSGTVRGSGHDRTHSDHP